MSYTRLPHNDADISFQGQSEYTRLTFNDADISFVVIEPVDLPFLNAAINSYQINATAINTLAIGKFNKTISGDITKFNQRVGVKKFVNKTITSFEQTIRQIRRLDNNITVFKQQINKRLSNTITNFEQIILPPAATNVDKFGWDVLVVVNGQEIPHSILTNEVRTDHQENSSSFATIELLPEFGIQNLKQYVGKRITIDYLNPNGVDRIYSGIVSSPEIDTKRKRISLNCSNDRETLINQKMKTIVPTIGFYSSQLTPTDNPSQELEERLKTVPIAVDFDYNENPQVTSWFAKDTADFILSEDKVFYDKENIPPSVTWFEAARVTNKINLSFTYQYQRLYHWERQFRWLAPHINNICDFITNGYSLCPRDAIRNAIDGTGWKVRNEIAFDPVYATGWYRCGGVDFVWSNISLQGTSVPQTDSEGNNITDEDGNQIFNGVVTGITDYSQVYCLGFSANMSTRWLQNIDEQYNLTITAPQSIQELGTIEENQSGSINADDDELVEGWEDYNQYTPPPFDSITSPSYYIDRRNNVPQFTQALTAAINTARTTILSAHRQTTVNVAIRVNPKIELKHTLEITTDPVKCRGKVRRIQHILDVINRNRRYMIVDIAIFQAGNVSVMNSSFVPPAKPIDNLVLTNSPINLNSWYGVDPTTIGANLFNGHIGNRWRVERVGAGTNRYRTNFQEAFIIDTPQIPNEWRLQRDLIATNSYNVAIPDDYLVIEF